MKCLVRDIPVNYEEVGTGRPLLLLHWAGLDHRHVASDLEPVFENRAGWRRLYPDLPGTGQTPGADWISSMDDMLEVVLGFMDTVAPGERFVVGGVSYGGILARALLHSRQAQIDSLLLIVPGLDEPEGGKLPPFQVIVDDMRSSGFVVRLPCLHAPA